MRKIVLIFSVVCLVFTLSGCVQTNKTGQYSDFVRRESNSADEQEIDISKETIRIYGVYPEKVATEGKEMIKIYGAGFEQGAKIFLNNPQISLTATYLNPGTLEAAKFWLVHNTLMVNS